MSQRRLPPLNLLRGFDAAARHLSFTKAADELNVTQGAISRQVKDLEVYLGQALFVRHIRRIELTDAGRQLSQATSSLLDELEQVTGSLEVGKTRRTLTVSALPTIASSWLMPRLHALNELHPGIELRMVASIEPVDLAGSAVDIAIRVGKLPGRRYERLQPRIDLTMLKSWSHAVAEELFPDELVPVCAPTFLGRKKLAPADLAKLPLIHTSTRAHAWPDWLRALGVKTRIESAGGLQFGHFFLSMDAARQGRGVAIVPSVVLAQAGSMQGLVIPYYSDVRSAGEYYMIVHETKRMDPHVQQFRNWVLSEAAVTARKLDALKARLTTLHRQH
jgi:LysR family glycine cleavage system transcriptional activator